MMPVPIVAATFRWKSKKAMKLKKAAHTTAARGLRTRVETTVATELAASWKPLRKSNNSARPISSQTTSDSCCHGTVPRLSPADWKKCMASAALDDDLGDGHGHVLAGVDRLLEPAIQLAPLDQLQQVGRVGEEGAVGLAVDGVGLVFQPADLA